MSVKAVLSDLGGVLIEYSLDLSIAEWATQADVEAEVLAGRLVVDEAFAQFEVGRLTEGQFFSHLREQCGLRLTDDELMHGWNSIYIGVNREVERLLRSVRDRGVRVVAVTNTNVSHQRAYEKRFADSLSLFAAVYTSCELGARKPDPEFFEHVLESEALAPHEALFIDDLEVNVEGGRNVGLDVVLYTGVDGLREALARRGLAAVGPTG